VAVLTVAFAALGATLTGPIGTARRSSGLAQHALRCPL
jgi:hypothetical protein